MNWKSALGVFYMSRGLMRRFIDMFEYDRENKFEKINMNDLAIQISKIEGKRKQVNIAQIKEVLKATRIKLNEYDDEQIIEAVRRIGKK